MNCLTGREQNRIPKNKITNRRKTAKRKIHLNLRQMINFMVLQGCVNQKNDVSGRLFIGDKKTNNSIQMYIHTHAYQSVGTFLTLVGLVWGSCLAHLFLSLQASLASPSPPLFQVSFLLSPAKYNSVIRKHRLKKK